MTIEKILIVEDEMLLRNFLFETLKRKGMDVTAVENGEKALRILKDSSFDMVITDMKMPGLTGIDVLKKVKELSSGTMVIVITAFGSIENAVEAMRLGAFHYLIKPFSPDTIEAIIDKANEHQSLVAENHYLRQQVQSGSGRHQPPMVCVGNSPALRKILENVKKIAQSNASVFITGESGTGKEVIAQTIHYHSLRSQRPFIKCNCAAIPDTLIESEFFGHEKGSFTGAHAKRLGRFELANQGTLLLDEVTEIPLSLQSKLLRAIQEQEFERVGGTKPIKVDVRLISTSNRNMEEAIAQKVLREDLFYRLNVVPIYLPPLRERKEDILPLAEYFLQVICRENHSETKELTPEAQKVLLDYSWPGNVRELANIIERAVVMDSNRMISPEYLTIGTGAAGHAAVNKLPVGMTLQELEKRLIVETLEAHKNDRNKAALTLGISIRSLRTKLSTHNIAI